MLGEAGGARSHPCARPQGAERWPSPPPRLPLHLTFPSLPSPPSTSPSPPVSVAACSPACLSLSSLGSGSAGKGGNREPGGKGITTPESRGCELAVGIIFKRISLFVMFVILLGVLLIVGNCNEPRLILVPYTLKRHSPKRSLQGQTVVGCAAAVHLQLAQ